MKYYGKSEQVCQAIVDQFRTGNLPAALAPVFVNRRDNVPSASWSFMNRFIMALSGTADARGYDQWKKAGRQVCEKGAIYILAPCLGKIKKEDEETGEVVEGKILYGFKSIPVFPIEKTKIVDEKKWAEAGGVDLEEERRLQELPLREVAEAWGLNVSSYNGAGSRTLGYYSHGKAIALGVENLSTWTHELIHAADDKAGTITKAKGQQPDNEIVAELGGAVLLEIMGHKTEADLGGAWDYIKRYADGNEAKATKRCMNLLNRICTCVALVLETAEKVEPMKEAA